MKTNIKSLVSGVFAATAVVAISSAVQAQPLTGWGLANISGGGYQTSLTLSDSGSGTFKVFGTTSGNIAYMAVLPQKYILQNVGDRITVTGSVTWTNGSMGGGQWRIYLGDTNTGTGWPGTLSGGVWNGQQSLGWLGYNLNAGGVVGAAFARPGTGTTRAWPSTALDVTALNLYPFYSTIPGVIPAVGMNAVAAPYYFTLQVQLVAPQVSAVGWSVTNAAFVTNGPNAFGDSFTLTNWGVLIDDGTLCGPLTGGRVQQLATKTFDVLGLFENTADRIGCNEIDYNNVTVSFTTGNVNPFTNLVIDAFDPTGIGANNYSGGQLINVWTNWFGAAWVTNEWIGTNDANPLADGSIRVTATWPNMTPAAQFMEWNRKLVQPFNGLPGNLDSGLNLRIFGADVFFDADSPVITNNEVPIYGHLRFGMQDQNGNFQEFSNTIGTTGQGFDYPQASNGWRHLHFPINAFTCPYETAISNIAFGIDGNWYPATPLTNGTTRLFVDNISFLEQKYPPVRGPALAPTMGIQTVTPALRMFEKANARYQRAELAATNQNESWVGQTYPVTYAFTLTNIQALGAGEQLQFWFVAVNAMSTADQANVYGDSAVDISATNVFALTISNQGPTNQNYHAFVGYKIGTNGLALNLSDPGLSYLDSNGDPVRYVKLATNYSSTVFGPATGNGQWRLTFTSANQGNVSGPGLTPVSFTMPSGDEAYFSNPLVLYWGIQNNGSPGIYSDLLAFNITNNPGDRAINQDFTTGANYLASWAQVGPSGNSPGDPWLVQAGSAYWINWSSPSLGFDVEVNTNGVVNLTDSGWVAPAFYQSYSPWLDERLEGINNWTIIPTADLPPGQANFFFRMHNPPNKP